MNNEKLNEIITEAARRFGFEEASAQFSPERDLKVCWTRTQTTIDFWVSDYLADADAEIVSSVAETILNRIRGNSKEGYSDNLVSYVTSEDFYKRYRPVYLQRFGGVTDRPEGRHKDLGLSYERLIRKELIEDDGTVMLGWAPMPLEQSVGCSSTLMRTVLINRRLDEIHVSDDLLDFCLYSQMAFIQIGFLQNSDEREQLLKDRLNSYPDHDVYESLLEALDLRLWKNVSPEC